MRKFSVIRITDDNKNTEIIRKQPKINTTEGDIQGQDLKSLSINQGTTITRKARSNQKEQI